METCRWRPTSWSQSCSILSWSVKELCPATSTPTKTWCRCVLSHFSCIRQQLPHSWRFGLFPVVLLSFCCPAGALRGRPSPGHRLRPAGRVGASVELGSAAASWGGGGQAGPSARSGLVCRSSRGVWHPAEPGVSCQLHPAGSRLHHVHVRKETLARMHLQLFTSLSDCHPFLSAWILANL